MKVSIKKIKPEKYPENEVTSHEWKMAYRSSSILMHPEGLFSNKIFGRLEHCECGLLQKPGYCKVCENRVVDINNLPDYWFDMGLKILGFMPEWNKLALDKSRIKNIEEVLEYTHFVYISEFLNDDGEKDFNISVEEMPEINEDFDYNKFNQENIYIGEEAALLLGVSQEWLDNNMTDTLLIPHPNYRPLIRGGDDKPLITDINQHYQDIIIKCNNVKGMLQYSSSKLHDLISRYKISQIYKEIITELQDVLQGSRFSVIRSEIIAHPISGAVRGTLLNRHDVNEDVILIGDQFVESLYPFLYRKYDGNMFKINKELIEKDYVLMLNRPPSISYFSTMGMKPRIASLYPVEHMDGTNGALLSNDKYVESGLYKENNYFVQGDIEGLSPQYIGRKNYDSVPQQKDYNVKKKQYPKNIKVMVHSPYGINYPKDNISVLKRDRNAKPLTNEEKTKLDTRIANYYYQEDIEEFLYKHGYTTEDSFIQSHEILDKVQELKYCENLDQIKIKGLTVRKIISFYDKLTLNMEFSDKNGKYSKIMDKEDSIKTLAIALLESENLNYKTFVSRKDSPRIAYNFKKNDLRKMIKGSIQGVDIFNEYIAERLNLVAKANLLLTEDNRRNYEYIDSTFLSSLTGLNQKSKEKELNQLIYEKLSSCETLNKEKENYTIVENSSKEENGELVPQFTKDEVYNRREELLKETANYLTRLYQTEYVRLHVIFNNINLEVRKDKNSEFKPILALTKENSDLLKVNRVKSEEKIFEIKAYIDSKEEYIENLNEVLSLMVKENYSSFDFDSLDSDLNYPQISGLKNIKEIRLKIKELEKEILDLNESIDKIIEKISSIDDIEIEDLYKINGIQNGFLSEYKLKENLVEYLSYDSVLVENVRGLSINPITCDGQSSDFDGDVLLAIAIYGNDSMAEVRKMLSSQRYINYADGTIRNSIVEDLLYCSDLESRDIRVSD